MQTKMGFSLVELSIVLVILGLLTGGILTGKSLIKAAELRAVAAEFKEFQTAFDTFKTKYLALPGDMTDATMYWGKSSTYCNSDSGTAQATGICNGNGDGILDESPGPDDNSERFMVWAHLTRAGLLQGNYSGISGTGSRDHAIANQNVPGSKFPNGAWCFNGTSTPPGDSFNIGSFGNAIEFGSTTNSDDSDNPLLVPEDAWHIDKKIDDGKPGAGNIIALERNDCTTATSNTDFSANYELNDRDVECALSFIRSLY